MNNCRQNLENFDPEVYGYLNDEIKRQERHIELIALENFVSKAVFETMGTELTNKYAEGYPGKRYYGGCEYVDKIEQLAIDRLKKLSSADHANVQPHCGVNASIAVYVVVLEPGDTVLGMRLTEGGHLTHGSPVNMSGKFYNFVDYGVDPETGTIDYENVRELALKHKPRLTVAGVSAYPRITDFKKFREITDEVGAYLMVGMAHIAGLVAAGDHPSLAPYADPVTTTIHETLRGPGGGAILCKEGHKELLDKSVLPGLQGGPLEHIIVARAVRFKEDLQPEFKEYTHQILKNAKAMERVSLDNDVRLASGSTDNHLLLIDCRGFGMTGKEAENVLSEVNITTNRNTIPNDLETPFVISGIRTGTPVIIIRGLKGVEVTKVAEFMIDALKKRRPAEEIKNDVAELMKQFPVNR